MPGLWGRDLLRQGLVQPVKRRFLFFLRMLQLLDQIHLHFFQVSDLPLPIAPLFLLIRYPLPVIILVRLLLLLDQNRPLPLLSLVV